MINKNTVNILLIRHGEANASWDEDRDPGLSEKGKLQSELLEKEILNSLPSRFDAISLARSNEPVARMCRSVGFSFPIRRPRSTTPPPWTIPKLSCEFKLKLRKRMTA